MDFVGLDGDVEDLVANLVHMDGDEGYQVVSICGMGGLGKTTLAIEVFNHKDVRRHFEGFAWVSISRHWQFRDVLERILSELVQKSRDEITKLRDEELINELYTIQLRKRFLVVLDDIWSTDFWDRVRAAFPSPDGNSKLLITTRNKKVCMHIDPTGYLHQPACLNAENSWELFMKKAFPRNRSPDLVNDRDIEEVGRQMVEQCGGLPAAIIFLGGLFASQSSSTQWKEAKKNLRICSSSDGRGVYDLLASSYYDLPYKYKNSFLHLGNFPKGGNIPTRKLYQMWVAEGFIELEGQGDGGESTMDSAERHLRELVDRCMVQVQIKESTGRFSSCRLHVLMHDLCLLKGEEENFLHTVHSQSNHGTSSSSRETSASTPVMRRLAITVDLNFKYRFLHKQDTKRHIRSAIFFREPTYVREINPTIEFLCTKFELLRVLDLENFCCGRRLPEAIGNLLHLRYLGLKRSSFEILPSSLRNLESLQTLDLRISMRLSLTVPDILWRLQSLRHLYLPSPYNSTYLDLSGLTRLEILKNFQTKASKVRHLSKLTKLRKLKAVILNLSFDELKAFINYLNNPNELKDSSLLFYYKFNSEAELALLSQLLIMCHHLRKLELNDYISRLPEPCDFSRAINLTKLTLRNCRLKEDPMATLEKLPMLNTLLLHRNAFEGRKIRCSKEGFLQLKIIEICELPNLEKWVVDTGAMPRLLQLEINRCEKLKKIPDGLASVRTIQELKIINMPEDFKRRLQKGGKDLSKVQHICTVTIPVKLESTSSRNQSKGQSFLDIFRFIGPSAPRPWQTS